jgi:hypothetical protein
MKEDNAPTKSRRWWKGLGQIVQGAAVAGADIGLAIGVLHVSIPTDSETYGVVMSVTARVQAPSCDGPLCLR